MIKVNVHEAKTKLSALLTAVEEKGECVRICRNGKPIADLRPVADAPDPLKRHSELEGVVFQEDPSLPLRDGDWPESGISQGSA